MHETSGLLDRPPPRRRRRWRSEPEIAQTRFEQHRAPDPERDLNDELWSRVGGYDPTVLDEPMKRRELFETPPLILPISELPIHAATMRAYRSATDPGGSSGIYAPGDNAGGGT